MATRAVRNVSSTIEACSIVDLTEIDVWPLRAHSKSSCSCSTSWVSSSPLSSVSLFIISSVASSTFSSSCSSFWTFDEIPFGVVGVGVGDGVGVEFVEYLYFLHRSPWRVLWRDFWPKQSVECIRWRRSHLLLSCMLQVSSANLHFFSSLLIW